MSEIVWTKGIAELTVGAPRSAREALESGAISLEMLRSLHQLDDRRSVADIGLMLLSMAAIPILYGVLPAPIGVVAGVLLAIRTFNSAAQLVHESDHGTLFRNPQWNARMGNLCAYLLGYTRSGHRRAHMDHHQFLNTDRDPDIIFSQPNASGREIVRGLVEDLLFISAVKRFLQYFQSDRAGDKVSPWHNLDRAYVQKLIGALGPVALAQVSLLVLYTLVAGPAAYFVLHVLPIMTLYPFQIRVRSIAEHAFEPGYGPGSAPTTTDEAWTTRTSRLGILERFIIAPLGQYLHYEHHVFPSLPNYNLPRAHRLLEAAGIRIPLNRSYFGFVFGRIRSRWTGLNPS